MQIIRGRDGPFNASNGLPVAFRLSLLETGIFWSMIFLFRVLCQLATPAFLLFGIHILNASLSDCLYYFGPMLVAQFVAATWVSEGRMLPIMVDVQQLLIAPEVIRAVLSALFDPSDKKFKVTAKGVLRDRNTVHWGLLARYGALIAANVIGIAYALSSTASDWIATGILGTVFWTWYNLLILLVCCLVCVERPRHRQHERYEVRLKGLVRFDGKERYFFTRDVSVGGMSFEGMLPGSLGDPVSIRFSGRELVGVVCREDQLGYAVMFTDGDSREAMTSFIYNETVCKETAQLNLGGLVGKLLKRAAA
jgi:cellulose synthase (UDP-forming)